MKVWITKYALTKGIMEEDAAEISSNSPRICSVEYDHGNYSTKGYYHGDDWHTTKDAALNRAEQMRLAKIASLKKSISNLEKLTFSTKEAAP